MNTRVLYHSTTGNTTRLAEAIAEAAGVAAEPISGDGLCSGSAPGRRVLGGAGAPSGVDDLASRDSAQDQDAPVDLLFIGGPIHMMLPTLPVRRLVARLDPHHVSAVAVFGTYGRVSYVGEAIAWLARRRGLRVVGTPFVRRGQAWGIINRGRPTEEDLAAARRWAREVIATASEARSHGKAGASTGRSSAGR